MIFIKCFCKTIFQAPYNYKDTTFYKCFYSVEPLPQIHFFFWVYWYTSVFLFSPPVYFCFSFTCLFSLFWVWILLDHVVNITGPKNIQDILLPKMNLISKNYNFMGEEPKIYLKDTKYEFTYQKVNFNTTKTVEYVQLLEKYKQKKYTLYNFL